MGRIVVFSIYSCIYCQRARKALQHRFLPFVEISLDRFPERRQDMLDLSGKMTVPQIFINTRWIGGCDELMVVLNEWEARGDYWFEYLEAVARLPDPTDPRLCHPLTPLGLLDEQLFQHSDQQLRGSSLADDHDAFFGGYVPLPDGTRASIGEVTGHLVRLFPRHKLAYLAKYYQDCFTGSQGVNALLEIFPALCRSQDQQDNEDRKRAVGFGNLLLRCGILHHVCDEHELVDTKDYYYRLQPFHQPYILNSFQSQQQVATSLPLHIRSKSSIFTSDEDTSLSGSNTMLTASGALKLLRELQAMLSDIELRATGRDGVDFLATKDYNDPAFIKLEEGSCQLQCMDGIALASTMTDAEKMVWGITLYNTMIRHAHVKLGVPTTASQRRAFFTGVKYKVANQILSLDDVEHGILRANTRHPYHLKQQFVGDDPRRAWAMEKLDPRVHFTMWCGAKSCPPIKAYTKQGLEEELQLAAEAFCLENSNVLVDEDNNTLKLSMVFRWYKNDFGCTSSKELPEVVLRYLPEGSEKHAALTAMILQSKSPGRYSAGNRRFSMSRPQSESPDRARSKSPSTRETWGGVSSERIEDAIKVKFIPYDWTPQAAPGKFSKFTSSNLKTTETSLKAPFSKRAMASLKIGAKPSNIRSKERRRHSHLVS